MVSVLKAITSALTVDSNMTNSDVMSLATKLGGLAGSAATFVTAPTQTVNGKLVLNTAIADQLWTAIKKDDLAGFAEKYPATVTPLGRALISQTVEPTVVSLRQGQFPVIESRTVEAYSSGASSQRSARHR